MKVYSIGRDNGCDIVIDDQSDVVSRRHAILYVRLFGRMTIVDQSHNGTYINGIRISSNVPVPVSRKDNISFAHIARLDWHLIPNPQKKVLWYSLAAIATLLIISGCIWGCNRIMNNSGMSSEQKTSIVDSTKVRKDSVQLKQEEERKQDSLKQYVKDSLQKANSKKTKIHKEPQKQNTNNDKVRKEKNKVDSNKNNASSHNSSEKSQSKTIRFH